MSELGALDTVFEAFGSAVRSLPEHRTVALPAELARIEGAYGGKPLVMRNEVFAARGVRWGRLARIDGPGTWVLNAIVYPEDGFTTPIPGIEVLVFRGRLHLVVADLFPLAARDVGVMDDIGPQFDALGETPPMPRWAEQIFSRRPIFRKPRADGAFEEGARAMALVLERWMERARCAEPEAGDATDAARARGRYVACHAEDEPAVPFLEKTYGAPLARRLVDEVLFPVALREEPTEGS